MLQKLLVFLPLTLLPVFPAYSQDVCYMIRENGRRTNLEHICGTLAQQPLSLEQRYLLEYKAVVSQTRSAALLVNSANTQPDVTIGLAKEVCRVLRSGGDRRDAAIGWARTIQNAPTEEMREALSDDAAATMIVAPKYFCPDQVDKI